MRFPFCSCAFLKSAICLAVSLFFFFLFLVTASRPFLTPYEAAPPTAPAAIALPPAMRAGMSAAKGRIPPFCVLRVLLPLRFGALFFDPSLLISYEYS